MAWLNAEPPVPPMGSSLGEMTAWFNDYENWEAMRPMVEEKKQEQIRRGDEWRAKRREEEEEEEPLPHPMTPGSGDIVSLPPPAKQEPPAGASSVGLVLPPSDLLAAPPQGEVMPPGLAPPTAEPILLPPEGGRRSSGLLGPGRLAWVGRGAPAGGPEQPEDRSLMGRYRASAGGSVPPTPPAAPRTTGSEVEPPLRAGMAFHDYEEPPNDPYVPQASAGDGAGMGGPPRTPPGGGVPPGQGPPDDGQDESGKYDGDPGRGRGARTREVRSAVRQARGHERAGDPIVVSGRVTFNVAPGARVYQKSSIFKPLSNDDVDQFKRDVELLKRYGYGDQELWEESIRDPNVDADDLRDVKAAYRRVSSTLATHDALVRDGRTSLQVTQISQMKKLDGAESLGLNFEAINDTARTDVLSSQLHLREELGVTPHARIGKAAAQNTMVIEKGYVGEGSEEAITKLIESIKALGGISRETVGHINDLVKGHGDLNTVYERIQAVFSQIHETGDHTLLAHLTEQEKEIARKVQEQYPQSSMVEAVSTARAKQNDMIRRVSEAYGDVRLDESGMPITQEVRQDRLQKMLTITGERGKETRRKTENQYLYEGGLDFLGFHIEGKKDIELAGMAMRGVNSARSALFTASLLRHNLGSGISSSFDAYIDRTMKEEQALLRVGATSIYDLYDTPAFVRRRQEMGMREIAIGEGRNWSRILTLPLGLSEGVGSSNLISDIAAPAKLGFGAAMLGTAIGPQFAIGAGIAAATAGLALQVGGASHDELAQREHHYRMAQQNDTNLMYMNAFTNLVQHPTDYLASILSAFNPAYTRKNAMLGHLGVQFSRGLSWGQPLDTLVQEAKNIIDDEDLDISEADVLYSVRMALKDKWKPKHGEDLSTEFYAQVISALGAHQANSLTMEELNSYIDQAGIGLNPITAGQDYLASMSADQSYETVLWATKRFAQIQEDVAERQRTDTTIRTKYETSRAQAYSVISGLVDQRKMLNLPPVDLLNYVDPTHGIYWDYSLQDRRNILGGAEAETALALSSVSMDWLNEGYVAKAIDAGNTQAGLISLRGQSLASIIDSTRLYGGDSGRLEGYVYEQLGKGISLSQFQEIEMAAKGDPLWVSKNYKRLGGIQYQIIDPITGKNPFLDDINQEESALLGQTSFAGMQWGDLGSLEEQKSDLQRWKYEFADLQYYRNIEMRNAQQSITTGFTDPRDVMLGSDGTLVNISQASFDSFRKIFEDLGFGEFKPGDGRTMWQLEDDGMRLSREQSKYNIEYSEEGLRRNQLQLDLTKRQFYENWEFGQERFAYGTQYKAAQMQFSRGMQLEREEWSVQDWAFNRNSTQLQFGWSMEDYDRNIRYARGRERRDLLRQKERQVVQYSMSMGRSDVEKERIEQQAEWTDEVYEREKRNFEQETEFSRRQMDMQRRHFEEKHQLDRQEMDRSRERFENEKRWTYEQWAIEDQYRVLQRQATLLNTQSTIQMEGAARELEVYTRRINTNMEIANITMGNMTAGYSLALKESKLLIDWWNNTFQSIGVIGSGGSGSSGGGGGGARLSQFSSGGYTGDGPKTQVAGLVHKGEYVVPSGGALVKSENMETVRLLGEVVQVLKDIRDKGTGTTTIYTNDSSRARKDALTLMDLAYNN
jgi:hypothetical protein